MTQSQRSPLARLVLFMIGLSIIGSAIAGTYYNAVDLPQHQNVQAPANNGYCNEMIIEAMHHACPRTDCDLCVTIAETKLECQVSTSDKIAICGPTG
jgi:hypothetical protein